MSRKSLILLLLLFGVLVFEIIVFAPKEVGIDQRPNSSASSPEAELDETKELSAKGLHVVESKGASVDWELWAENADRRVEDQLWSLEDVRSKFYGVKKVEYTVTGNKGQVSEDRKQMVVEGNVLTQSTNGYRFESDGVTYNSKEKHLESESQIRMLGPVDKAGDRLKLTGKGLTADLNTNTIFVKNDVRAQKMIKKDQVVTIKSKKARFNNFEKTAKFIGNVVIDFEDMRITGPVAEFKYKKGSDLIDSVVVDGGVRVTDVDKWATSDKVSVFFEKDKYVFQGKPRVVQQNDELRGDKIVFLNGGKKVRVENARAKFEPEEKKE